MEASTDARSLKLGHNRMTLFGDVDAKYEGASTVFVYHAKIVCCVRLAEGCWLRPVGLFIQPKSQNQEGQYVRPFEVGDHQA
jgi:hypothetical protein